jgi:hypothetical protein
LIPSAPAAAVDEVSEVGVLTNRHHEGGCELLPIGLRYPHDLARWKPLGGKGHVCITSDPIDSGTVQISDRLGRISEVEW